MVGKEVFAESLKSYIKKYQFSNADFQDLIDIIIEQALDSDISIQDWAEDWIKTAGVNELEPIISRDESRKIVNFIVKQTPGLLEFPTLRYHKINVEFFDSSMNSIQKFTINVLPQLETVFDQFNGIEAHCAILNVDDWGYCKVIIDEFSMKSLKKHFSSISNPLTRLIIYKALWDMVTDIKLSAVEFIECFIAAQIPLETNLYVLDYAFNIATQAMNFIPSEALKEQVMHEIFNIIVNKIENSVNDEELFLFKNMSYQFLYAKSDIERCLNWLKNNATDVKNWELECYERWNILTHPDYDRMLINLLKIGKFTHHPWSNDFHINQSWNRHFGLPKILLPILAIKNIVFWHYFWSAPTSQKWVSTWNFWIFTREIHLWLGSRSEI